jgi:EipB-like
MRLVPTVLVSLLVVAAAPLPSPTVASSEVPAATAIHAIAVKLAGHRALYQLALDQTRGGDVVAATGTMGYEVVDACNAWATRQRLDMTLTNRDGQDVKMISDYATWEAKDGLSMRFHMRQLTDGAVTQQLDGSAMLTSIGGPGTVHYTAPTDTTIALPAGTLFPMTHTAAIIAAGEAGQRFMGVPLFDGTGPDGAQDSFVVVENWDKPSAYRFPALAELPSGRVHIAFFDRTPTAQEPDYEAGMRYWENGIADNLRMDFGDFVMDGKLATLSVPQPHC